MKERSRSRLLFAALAAALTLASLFTVGAFALEEFPADIVNEIPERDYAGSVVILHSNDVHGAVDGYPKIANLRSEFESMGAQVLMIDGGDFSQGGPYVGDSSGLDAVALMNAVGYDIAGLGNHEFDYGYENMLRNLESA